MSTHNLCFERKYEKYQILSYENFLLFVVHFSIYLDRHIFVMYCQPYCLTSSQVCCLYILQYMFNRTTPYLLMLTRTSPSSETSLTMSCYPLKWSQGNDYVHDIKLYIDICISVTSQYKCMELINRVYEWHWFHALELERLIGNVTTHLIYCLTWHYENRPIQIYRKFSSKNWKVSDNKTLIYFIFLLKI